MDKMASDGSPKKVFVFITGFILGGVMLYGGAAAGWLELPAKKAPPEAHESILEADTGILWSAISVVKDRYFKINDIKDEDLLYGAIKGAVEALGDPYSSFFNPSDARKFEEDIQGSFGGIGAEIGIRNSQLLIIAPLKGNPAEAAGLRAGDKILKVDDTLTNDLTIEEAVKIIRGEVGTEVTLLIFREGWNEAREFKVVRAFIVVPTLDLEMKEDRIVHLKLYNFNASASQLFYEAALKTLLQGSKGVILDLRNNSGGYLEVANTITSWFLERGEVIVKERFRSGEENVFRASGPAALASVPTVVIVNGGSASASEILAGALRDVRGVKIVGEKTFGKGTVQEIESLKDGSSIKISIAEWLTPLGSRIEGTGLTPDFEIKLTDEDVEKQKDPQFDRALQILEEEIAESGGRIFVIGS